jgi:uncharacterized metal-binding protein
MKSCKGDICRAEAGKKRQGSGSQQESAEGKESQGRKMYRRHNTGDAKRPEMLLSTVKEATMQQPTTAAVERGTGSHKETFYCLAGPGRRMPGMIKAVTSADSVLVLDGCPVGCGKKAADSAGMTPYTHLMLGTLGIDRRDVLAWQAGDMDNALDVCRKLMEMQREAQNE